MAEHTCIPNRNKSQVTSLQDLEYSYTPPSSQLQAECGGKMFCSDARECIAKCVSGHIVCRAVDKVNRSFLNNEMDEVMVYVNVFHSSMVRTVMGECDSSLRVRVEWNQIYEWLKNFSDETMEPDCFHCSVSGGNIFSFGGRKGNMFLLLWGPRNDTTIDQKHIFWDCMMMLLWCTISICKYFQTFHFGSKNQSPIFRPI
jgi:hypothetical protein